MTVVYIIILRNAQIAVSNIQNPDLSVYAQAIKYAILVLETTSDVIDAVTMKKVKILRRL